MKDLLELVNAAMPSLAPMSPASPTKDVPDDETRRRMEKRDEEQKRDRIHPMGSSVRDVEVRDMVVLRDEEDARYEVLEVNGDRLLVKGNVPGWKIQPTKRVMVDDVIKVLRPKGLRSGHLTSSFTYAKPERHYDVESLRGNSSGYIGGANVARKASDDELILIAQLKDEAAGFVNHAKEFSDRAESIMRDIERRKG